MRLLVKAGILVVAALVVSNIQHWFPSSDPLESGIIVGAVVFFTLFLAGMLIRVR